MLEVLKHKDIDVAIINFNSMGSIVEVKEVLNKDHMPLSSIREDGALDEERFIKWWVNRGISENREEYKVVMRELDDSNKEKLLFLSKGLSLSDHYWKDKLNSDNKWKNINFYENEFDKSLGNLFFGIKAKNKKYSFNSPDITSSGNLKKRWDIREDGKRILIKTGKRPYMQEPSNEVIATNICKKLGIICVPYIRNFRKDEPRSICINMTDKNKELVEAIDIYYSHEPSYSDNNMYKHFLKCALNLNIKYCIEYLDKMMVLDYIMLNHDRHFKNFGILRNSDNLNNYEMAPIYDTGSSLFHEDGVGMIRLPEYAKTRTICFDTLEKQLDLVKNWDWINSFNLKDIGKEAKDELLEIPSVETKRAILLGKIIEKRVENINIFADRKENKRRQNNLNSDKKDTGNSGNGGGR
ncbi:MAG: HipA domain-containing protein [Treponema sp.]|nr:HipA domain-containing protein [Treponema sp.]